MSGSMEWTRPLPRIDHNSDQGKACQIAVKTKLKDYLGQEYADDVLPLYIVVMLAHGNSAALVAENLEAFLGKNDAVSFTQWLIGHLEQHGDEYAAEDTGITEGGDSEAADKHDRHRRSPKARDEPAKEQRRDQAREKIQWRGEDDHDRRRSTDRDKRPRESPGRAERRHAPRHDREAEEGREEKRRRHELRELRPLDAHRHDRRRTRHRDEGHHYRDERGRDGHERERPRQAAERHRMEREAELDRELERRRELDYRERLLRERDWERERERGGFLRDRPRDRDWDRPPRYAREPLGLQMDRDDHEKAELDWREERARRLVEPRHQNGITDQALRREQFSADDDRAALEHPSAQPTLDQAERQQRSTVFDRLDTDGPRVTDREESARSLAAARKSVFDRLRGNRQPAAPLNVQPDALTDEELDEPPPARTLPAIRTAPRLHPQPLTRQLQSASKAEELAEMQRKMQELQQQVQQLEREQRTPRAAPTPVVVHTSAAPLQTAPSVDPRSVHVQNLSQLAIPDIIGAHFSGCGRVMNVTIARDLQGKPKGFAHVEFSNELEAQNALSLSGSILLNQVITVMPKVNRPPAHAHFALPGFGAARGRGRGRGSFGSPGRGTFRGSYPRPFSGRAPFPARGRGRQAPLASNKYVRPELKGQPDSKLNGTAAAAAPGKASPAVNGVAAPALAEKGTAAAPAADAPPGT